MSTASTPRDASRQAQAEAEAFVEHYWNTANAILRGDQDGLAELKAMATPGCVVCEDIAGDAEEFVRAGERLEGGHQSVSDVRYSSTQGSSALVSATVQSKPGKLFDRHGRMQETYRGGEPVKFFFALVKVEGDWRVQQIINPGA